MAWSSSGLHASWWAVILSGPLTPSLLTDPMRAALYDGTPTPNRSATPVAMYGTGQWAAGEVSDPPGWPAGGLDLGALTAAADAGEVTVTSLPTVTAGQVTLTADGTMIYDPAPAGAGAAFCFCYFGGPVQVAAGQLTVQWADTGVAVMGCPLLPGLAP